MSDKDLDIMKIEELNVEGALKLVGDLNLYREILYDYYQAIDEKIELIGKYEKEENIKNYTVEVHALKSSSRLIGADVLAKSAEYMEQCGHNNNIEEIHSKTAKLLDQYSSYKEIIFPYMKES